VTKVTITSRSRYY